MPMRDDFACRLLDLQFEKDVEGTYKRHTRRTGVSTAQMSNILIRLRGGSTRSLQDPKDRGNCQENVQSPCFWERFGDVSGYQDIRR